MEIFLASDVIYSQRVVPLIQETLTSNGIHGATHGASRFLPNLGWLEPNTVEARLTGKASTGGRAWRPATHGSSLVGVAWARTRSNPNRRSTTSAAAAAPTFTVTVENTGTNAETNVKVDVAVTAGRQTAARPRTRSTRPNRAARSNVEIPVTGVPLGVASKIEVNVEPVPGETNSENNKATYLAIFGE